MRGIGSFSRAPRDFCSSSLLRLCGPEVALGFSCIYVTAPRLLHCRHLRDFGNGYVPPAFIAGHAILVVSLHNHNRGTALLLHLVQGFCELFMRPRPHRECPQTGSVRDKVHLDPVTLHSVVAKAVFRAESLASTYAAQAVYA